MDLAGVYSDLIVMKGKKVKPTTPKATSILESLKQAAEEVRLAQKRKNQTKNGLEAFG